MKIHDLRKTGKMENPQIGDIVIWPQVRVEPTGLYEVARLVGDHRKAYRSWYIATVGPDEADMMIDINEWCEPCHDNGKLQPAVSFETSNHGDLFTDCYRCISCTHDRNRQEHEDAVWLAYNDYQDTLHGFEAGTGRM